MEGSYAATIHARRQGGEEEGMQQMEPNRGVYCLCFVQFGSHFVKVSVFWFYLVGELRTQQNKISNECLNTV